MDLISLPPINTHSTHTHLPPINTHTPKPAENTLQPKQTHTHTHTASLTVIPRKSAARWLCVWPDNL